ERGHRRRRRHRRRFRQGRAQHPQSRRAAGRGRQCLRHRPPRYAGADGRGSENAGRPARQDQAQGSHARGRAAAGGAGMNAKKTKEPKAAAEPKGAPKAPAPKAAISKEEMYRIVRAPVITEKATRGSEHNQVTFKVALDASKPEIKAAIEGIFGVKVKAVNTLRTEGKKKFFRGMRGQRSDSKKAIITLEAGQTIDVTTGV